MSTQDVANKLVDMCRNGEWEKATNELYADNIVSIEPEGAQAPTRVEGIDGKRAKDQQFAEMSEEMHSIEVSDPVVAANYFSCNMKMDMTFKGMGRMTMEEVCVYGVDQNGKINFEQFFYPTQG